MVSALRNYWWLRDIGVLSIHYISLLWLWRETLVNWRVLVSKHHIFMKRILICGNLLNKHMRRFIWCLHHIAIMVDHHTLRNLNSSTIIVIVNWSKVFVSPLLWCLLTSGIAQLRLILLMLFLHLLLAVHHVYISSVDILHKSNGLRAFLRDLNLASSHAVGDDMLGGSGTVLHIGDLGLSLGSTFSDSLDCSDDFLLILSLIGVRFISLLSRLGLVDLKL